MNEILQEILREVSVRVAVYPRLMAQGKMSEREAVRRIACLTHAVRLLKLVESESCVRAALTGGNPGTLYAQTNSWETLIWQWQQYLRGRNSTPPQQPVQQDLDVPTP